MTKIKKQAGAETLPTAPVEAAGAAAATAQEVTGDGAGQALPEVDGASAERDAPATESQAAGPAPAPAPELSVKTVDVLVLCTGNVAGNRYEAGAVLEGVPSDVAKTYSGMLDAHPDAVFYARAHGAVVSAYEG